MVSWIGWPSRKSAVPQLLPRIVDELGSVYAADLHHARMWNTPASENKLLRHIGVVQQALALPKRVVALPLHQPAVASPAH